MKKELIVILMLILIPIISANIYQQDSLEIDLIVSNEFELSKDGNNPVIKQVSADLLLYPQENFRQKVIEFESSGKAGQDKITFTWNSPELEQKHNLGYKTTVKTYQKQTQVTKKVEFPIKRSLITKYDEYLQPTETIDSNNPEIIEQATSLVEGEDDLFKVAFNLAGWIENNIEYDLNTLTTSASQKASWVLENKQGVCDEMTSLFIAMARSVGIPARFISGISYTEHQGVIEEVGSNWASHGWAELYFPEQGWVSFDIAFNEFGYIDVTHIKLRESLDPIEPAITYQWTSQQVQLESGTLESEVNIVKSGTPTSEDILLEMEILSPEVDFGSYNMIKGILKNKANYYTATTLRLAAPQEVIKQQPKRHILLSPKEVKEIFWVIQVSPKLEENYWYEFPLTIYSEKNVSITDKFLAQNGKRSYSENEIMKLKNNDQEKTYTRKIVSNCEFEREIEVNTASEVACKIKNIGNTNLKDVDICLEGVCERTSLPINQEFPIKIGLENKKAGWKDVTLSIDAQTIEKKELLQYAVLDKPKVLLETNYPTEIEINQPIPIDLNLKKDSFSDPQELIIILNGPGFEKRLVIPSLTNEENISLSLTDLRLASSNKFLLSVQWKDNKGRIISQKEEIKIKVHSSDLSNKFSLFFNQILNLFY